MSRVLARLVPLLFVASTAAAQQDHSHHQPADPHAEHRQPSTSEQDEHAEHRQPPASGQDEHAHHRAQQLTESERAHVPPDPPALVLGPMSNERMIELMQMEDDAALGMLRLDELEAFNGEHADGFAWEAHAWYGTDYQKVWLKTEGERISGETEGRAELLWDRIVSPWWSMQLGVRHDVHEGPSRSWAAIGLQGLAPQLVEIEATLYVGEEGRTAARMSVERDLLITQRLVLQPQLELEAYGKDDPENRIGSGLSSLEVGLRLRYELMREIAPYVGVQWERAFGETADLVRAAGDDASDLWFVAGVRAWF